MSIEEDILAVVPDPHQVVVNVLSAVSNLSENKTCFAYKNPSKHLLYHPILVFLTYNTMHSIREINHEKDEIPADLKGAYALPCSFYFCSFSSVLINLCSVLFC